MTRISKPAATDAIAEPEESVHLSIACIHLLSALVREEIDNRSPDGPQNDLSEELTCGLTNPGDTTSLRLRNAFRAVLAAMHSPPA